MSYYEFLDKLNQEALNAKWIVVIEYELPVIYDSYAEAKKSYDEACQKNEFEGVWLAQLKEKRERS